MKFILEVYITHFERRLYIIHFEKGHYIVQSERELFFQYTFAK